MQRRANWWREYMGEGGVEILKLTANEGGH